MKVVCLISMIAFLYCSDNASPTGSENEKTPELPGWNLVWSDEFEEDGLANPQKWGYDVGGSGWGNNELQYYTAGVLKNSRVEAGKLVIEAHREQFGSNDYTSARLVTKNHADWTFGRIEVSAKLPTGRGTWPAIWMLPTIWNYGNGSWPDNGEIDIMEHVGYDPGNVHASIHTKAYNWPNNTQKTNSIKIADAQTTFHVYAIEWFESKIDFFVDDVKFHTVQNENTGWQTWPFVKDFYLILNVAVGGNWGGAQGIDKSIFPAKMEVEYVRVYEKAE